MKNTALARNKPASYYEHLEGISRKERVLSVPVRIIFLRNEHSPGVRNGSLSMVESISREGKAFGFYYELDRAGYVAT
jgi:hypothetical protein